MSDSGMWTPGLSRLTTKEGTSANIKKKFQDEATLRTSTWKIELTWGGLELTSSAAQRLELSSQLEQHAPLIQFKCTRDSRDNLMLIHEDVLVFRFYFIIILRVRENYMINVS